MPRTSNELSKIMLMASDMAYAAGTDFAALNRPLQYYPDTPNIGVEAPYSVASGYVVTRVFPNSETGFKALAFRHNTTGDVIIAFAGTDGPDKKDWAQMRASDGTSGRLPERKSSSI